MTDSVTISPGHDNVSIESSRTFEHAGHVDGWVVPNTMELLTDIDADLAAGPLNAFAESSSGTSLDTTIDTGEAIVGGGALARDVTTTVTLAASTANQTVYAGWAHNATDTVKIGLAGDFVADDPRIPIWTYDTDGSGVTAVTDERRLGEQVDVQNTRYEGGGTKVDAAKSADQATNADQLGNAAAGSYARSDVNDTLDGVYAFTGAHPLTGTLDAGSRETHRLGGAASDLVTQVQGGQGRVAMAWNAYYDGTDWRSIVANEQHVLLSFSGVDPGPGADANLVLATGVANANAGDIVTWETMWMDYQGNLNMDSGELLSARIENRSNRPASPGNGRIIYRSDKD